MTAATCDLRALSVAKAVHERERPLATILFGSRARGDYEERRSDIDIMLVQAEEPDGEYQGSVERWAEGVVQAAYGRWVPVQLVWISEQGFNEGKRYINHVATQALFDGIIMTQNPEEYQNRDADDEEAEYEYDWTPYNERMRHAEAHLEAFVLCVENGMNDLIIGQQAQNTLEHAMKALLEVHRVRYQRTHNIGNLLGNIRHIDPELRDLAISIAPDIYTKYTGEQAYELSEPLLTDQPDYRERTVADAQHIINRAREVRQQQDA
ncbi:MAG: HEPN domain-containing protein [Dehalococcoidia bacterium]|nr:HEPN domain-containing protein [Dehalococcoidia bacterium]